MRVGVMIGSRFKDRVPERQPFGDSTVAKIGMGNGEESSVAAEGGAEPRGRAKRRRSRQLQGGNVEASGEVGGQSEAGIVPSADGVDAGTGEG
jgi:hypothetical protein